MSDIKLPSIHSLNTRLQNNQKRNPSLYSAVTLGEMKSCFPNKDNKAKFWRLKKLAELTKADQANVKLMKEFKKDTLLFRARTQAIACMDNLEKLAS